MCVYCERNIKMETTLVFYLILLYQLYVHSVRLSFSPANQFSTFSFFMLEDMGLDIWCIVLS